MSFIKTLKDKDGNIIYPQTDAKSVFLKDGSDLDSHQYLEQVTEMPEATEASFGQVVQYMGETNNDYTYGLIYKNEALESDDISNGTAVSSNSEHIAIEFFNPGLWYLYLTSEGLSPSQTLIYNTDESGFFFMELEDLGSVSGENLQELGLYLTMSENVQTGDTITITYPATTNYQFIPTINNYYMTIPQLSHQDQIIHYLGDTTSDKLFIKNHWYQGYIAAYGVNENNCTAISQSDNIIIDNYVPSEGQFYPAEDNLMDLRLVDALFKNMILVYQDGAFTVPIYGNLPAEYLPSLFGLTITLKDTIVNGDSIVIYNEFLTRDDWNNITLGTSGAGEGAEIFNSIENQATGSYSHAEGQNTIASSYYTHAEGYNTKATSHYSHAEGGSTTASGNYTHAEGSSTTASGHVAHAEGSGTTASNNYTHAEGRNTIAASECQHVQGKNNISDSNDTYAHIVGNGTGSSSSKRSNAHTLDWSGNAWFAGDVYVKSTSGTNKDDGSVKLATEEYVDNKFWIGTQEEYDALESKSDTIIYLIKDEEV